MDYDLAYFDCSQTSYYRLVFLGYKPKPRAKKERTEEEKKFKRRSKYFLAAQLVGVLVFLSLMGGADSSELDDDDGLDYED